MHLEDTLVLLHLELVEAGHPLGLSLLAAHEGEVPSGLTMRHAADAARTIIPRLSVAPVVLVLGIGRRGFHAV